MTFVKIWMKQKKACQNQLTKLFEPEDYLGEIIKHIHIQKKPLMRVASKGALGI
jgi:hypothetical protein